MPRRPAGSASIVSSQYVADDALPWTNKTGVPFSGPLKSAWKRNRGVSTKREAMPGKVGMLLIGNSSSSLVHWKRDLAQYSRGRPIIPPAPSRGAATGAQPASVIRYGHRKV